MKKFLMVLIVLGALTSSANASADEGITADAGLRLYGWEELVRFDSSAALGGVASVEMSSVRAPSTWDLTVGFRLDLFHDMHVDLMVGARVDGRPSVSRFSIIGKELMLLELLIEVGPKTKGRKKFPSWLWLLADAKLLGPGTDSMAANLRFEGDIVFSDNTWLRFGVESENMFVQGDDTMAIGAHVRLLAGPVRFDLAYRRMLLLPEREDQGRNMFVFRFWTRFKSP